MHKKLSFWLYVTGGLWWAVELWAQNGSSCNSAIPLYKQLAAIDVSLPGNSLLPAAVPSGAVYLLIGGVIAHRMGH